MILNLIFTTGELRHVSLCSIINSVPISFHSFLPGCFLQHRAADVWTGLGRRTDQLTFNQVQVEENRLRPRSHSATVSSWIELDLFGELFNQSKISVALLNAGFFLEYP